MGKIFASKYNIISLLGTGGMSEVCLAQNTRTGKKVAIKILDKKLSKDEEYIKRFKREIEISKTLTHPNIVKIISYGVDKGSYYIIYEHIDGLTLDKYIKSKKLSIKEIEDITLQILKGLFYAHSNNIIHRDIKPSNIMVSQDGNVKILDFGIAKATTRSTITKTGMFMGSPHYTSPEQIDGKKVDHRTDIYSLGIVLYEMVAGKVPFQADTPLGFVRAHLDKTVPKINNMIPSYLEEIVYKCLAKNPTDRFSSAEEIAKIIKSKYYGNETIIKPIRPKESKEAKKGLSNAKKVIIALGSIAVIAIIIVSIILGINYASGRQIVENEAKQDLSEESKAEAAEEAVAEVDEEEVAEPDPVNYNIAKVGAEIVGELPSTLYINTDSYIDIEIKNTSDFIWKSTGTDKVTIGYHYLNLDEEFVGHDGVSFTELPRDINPGETISLTVLIDEIFLEGNYKIAIDLFIEGYYWFSQKNVPVLEKEIVFTSKGEVPTISLQIYEGPTYSEADDTCYYRVKAEVTGGPAPEIEWSRDDSDGAWGSNKSQINLRSGESYTLMATAANSGGSSTDSINLIWNCEVNEKDTNSTISTNNNDKHESWVGNSHFTVQALNTGATSKYKKSLIIPFKIGWPIGISSEDAMTVSNFYYNDFEIYDIEGFGAYCGFQNLKPNSIFIFKTFKDNNLIEKTSYSNKDQTDGAFGPWIPVNGPALYSFQIYYDNQLILSASTEVLP